MIFSGFRLKRFEYKLRFEFLSFEFCSVVILKDPPKDRDETTYQRYNDSWADACLVLSVLLFCHSRFLFRLTHKGPEDDLNK